MKASHWFRLKLTLAFLVAALSILWYIFGTGQAQDLSILCIGTYFAGCLVLIGIWRLIEPFLGVSHSSWRRRARMFLYAPRRRGRYRGSSLGDTLDFSVTVLSITSCLMYVVETYRPSLSVSTAWYITEIVISMVFLFDYIIRQSVAVDVVEYLLSSAGVVNVVTSLPILVFGVELAFVSQEPLAGASRLNSKMTYLRLIRLAKLLRVLRAMHMVRGAANESLNRELFTLGFTVLCLVFSAAGFFQWLENGDRCFDSSYVDTMSDPTYKNNGCVHFHWAFYWSTIEILGRPRLVFEKDGTCIMLIGLTFLVCILIPKQLANVFAIMQSTNKYQRMTYIPSTRFARHLVIVGHKEFAAINMLLYEFFHPDRGDHPVQDVVLLFPTHPERDLEWLLLHPAYVGRVTYLQGTPLVEKDLERAGLATSSAVIVLANKDSDQPQWHDGELLTCIQAMKAFWLKDIVQVQRRTHFTSSADAARKFLRPRIVTQVLLPETKEYLIELPGWTDRDVVVVASEYLAWMLGMATLARGMATLVFNLMSHTEKQRYYRTRWYPRYEAGATQEIYTAVLRSHHAIVGHTLTSALGMLAKDQCILVAVERLPHNSSMDVETVSMSLPVRPPHHRREFEGLFLLPGPEGFQLAEGDRLLCIAKSLADLHNVLELASMEPKDTAVSWRSTSARKRAPSYTSSTVLAECPGSDLAETLKMDLQLHEEVQQTEQDLVHTVSRDTMVDHVPRGCENLRGLALTLTEDDRPRLVTTESPFGFAADGSPSAVCSPGGVARDDVVTKLSSITPAWKDHIVFCGLPQTQAGRPGGRGLVTELIETLKRAHEVGIKASKDGVQICIVDYDAVKRVADLCFIEPEFLQMATNGQLRAVSSDPRNRNVLIFHASIGAARAVVALPEPLSKALNHQLSTVEVREGKARHRMAKQILDTNTVLTMQVARGCAARARSKAHHGGTSIDRDVEKATSAWRSKFEAKLHCVTMLLQESTSNLFFGHANMRHSGAAAASDPRWMDISPLNMSPLFASGQLLATTCFDRFAVEALFTPQVVPLVRMLVFGDSLGHRLYQVYCPKSFVRHKYGEMLHHFCERGMPCLGLIRFPVEGSTVDDDEDDSFADLPDSTLPYVITNPDPERVILRSSDLVVILGSAQEIAILRQENPEDPDEGVADDASPLAAPATDDVRVPSEK